MVGVTYYSLFSLTLLPFVKGRARPESRRCVDHITGWSYGLDGRLAKAPRFDDVEGLDKTKNGLFPIHVHIDARGFVWVNLESSETPSVSWESRFAGSDTRDRLAEFNMDEYVFDHAWSMEGKYNWKACVDNYNEVCVPHPYAVSY